MKNKTEKRDMGNIGHPSANPVMGEPETVFEMINKYGTYNIQPTADTDNPFPTIAQGYPKRGDYFSKSEKKKYRECVVHLRTVSERYEHCGQEN